MAREQELSSISALMLDQFTTVRMTGWLPRTGSDEFNTMRLLQRDDRFFLSVANREQIIAEIALNDIVSYVIKLPTWHEVKLTSSSPLVALHLSKSRDCDFDHFYTILISVLKIVGKYDRLDDRISEQTFLDQLNVVQIQKMKRMSLGQSQTISDTRLRRSRAHSNDDDPNRSTRYEPTNARRNLQKSRSLPPPPADIPQHCTPSRVKSTVQECVEDIDLVEDTGGYYFLISADESATNSASNMSPWICSRCTLINKSWAYRCNACEMARSDAWLCRKCAVMNSINAAKCGKCDVIRCRRCDYQNDNHELQCAICTNALVVQ